MNTIGEIISTYRKKNKMSQPELAAELAKTGHVVTQKAVSKWETNANDPGANVLMHLSKILGINNLYEEYFGANPNDPLSQLNAEGKEKVYEYIDLLIASGKYKKTEAIIIPFTRTLNLYDIPVSAGTGNFLDESDYEEIEVGPDVPNDADFAVRITGNSMEPRFIDGQIVWIQKQDTLQNGEIGIFYLDGSAYIKKLKDDENGLFLISLNKKYAPIPVKQDSTFKTLGKVLC